MPLAAVLLVCRSYPETYHHSIVGHTTTHRKKHVCSNVCCAVNLYKQKHLTDTTPHRKHMCGPFRAQRRIYAAVFFFVDARLSRSPDPHLTIVLFMVVRHTHTHIPKPTTPGEFHTEVYVAAYIIQAYTCTHTQFGCDHDRLHN